jgi:hypothetical protein
MYVHKHLTKYYPSIQNKETEIKRSIGVYRRHRRGVKRKGLLGIPWRGYENNIKKHLTISRKGVDCVNLIHDESNVGHM